MKKKTKNRIEDFSFWEHLEDLRVKILWALGIFFLIFLVTYFYFSFKLIDFLVRFSGIRLYYISVFEPFLSRLKVSAFTSLLVSIPVFVVQILRFVVPGLKKKGRKILLILTVTVFLLSSGMGFLLFRFSPYLLQLFIDTFSSPSVSSHFSISTFLGFYMMLILVDAVLVLIPGVTYLLLKVGVLKTDRIGKVRIYLIPLFLFIAALITPPDPLSMLIVALPLWLLFEISVMAFHLTERKKDPHA